MSDELQKEIDRLTAENLKLAKDVAGLEGDLKETRAEARDRRHEGKTLAQQLADITKERDEYKGKAETTGSEWQGRIDELSGKVRDMKHEGAYAKVAKTLKVSDPTKLADLLKLAGHSPEGDEPDEAKIAATFQEALKGRPWLVDAPEAGASTIAPGGASGAAATETGGKPGPGADRGQSLSDGSQSQARERPAGRL